MLDFPHNPVLDQRFPDPTIPCLPVWEWDGGKWKHPCGADNIISAPTPPADPAPNQVWFDTTGGRFYLWLDTAACRQWVAIAPPSGARGLAGAQGSPGIEGIEGMQGLPTRCEHIVHTRMAYDGGVPAGSWFLLNYNWTDLDSRGWWDAANHVFRAGRAGIFHYQIISPYPIQFVVILKNDAGAVDLSKQVMIGVGNGGFFVGASGIVHMNANDYLRAWFLLSAGGTVSTQSGSWNCFISIHELGGADA